MRKLRNRLRAVRQRWRNRDDGAAAVEFALVVTVFMWLFMGIVELGLLMIFNSGLEDGVQRASRLIRTGQAQKQNLSKSEFRNQICSYVVLRSQCTSKLAVDVRTFRDFASIRRLPLPGTTMPSSYRIGGPQQVVLVRAFYEWNFLTPLIGRLVSNTGRNTFLLNVATTFRNEPFSTR